MVKGSATAYNQMMMEATISTEIERLPAVSADR